MLDHTILAAVVIHVLEAAEAIGLDREAIMEEAGIDPSILVDLDARLPIALDLRLWEILSREPIGLRLGEKIGLAGMGVVGYAMQHGSTVREALAWLERYRAVVHPGLVPRIEEREEEAGRRAILAKPIPPPIAWMREPVYAFAAGLVSTLRGLSGTEVVPRRVTYPLPAPSDADRHERFFQCAVAWGGTEFEIAFDAEVLDLSIPRSDSRLFSYLARRVDELLAELHEESSHADRVRHQIALLLAEGEPRLSVVARRLAMSERTLNRRLAEEGTRFAALVDEARRERALLLLEDRSVSCSEVAFLLGYADPAPFFRAFRRWTGLSPQAYRASGKGALV